MNMPCVIEGELDPVGCARLVAAAVTQALTAGAMRGNGDWTVRRRQAAGLRNIARNGLVIHFCDAYDIDEGRLLRAIAEAADSLEAEGKMTAREIFR